MLRGTLTCGRGGAVQTRLLCPWPTLVCTLRTLHKTGVLHPCLSPLGPGSCSRKHLAGVSGWSALRRRGVLLTEACLVTMDPLGWEWAAPQECIFSCHHFFPSCVFRNGIKAPLCQRQPQDHRPPSLFPRDHQSASVPTAQMGPTELCQAGVSVSSLCQGRQAPPVAPLCRGQVRGTSQGGPSLRERGSLLQLSAAPGSPGLLPPTGVLRCPGGLVGLA